MDRVLFKKLYFGVVLGVFVLVGGVTQVHAVEVGGITVQGNAANNTPTFNSGGVQINNVGGSNNNNTVSAGEVQLNNQSVTAGGINISNSGADTSNSSVKLGGQELGTYVQPKPGDVQKNTSFGCVGVGIDFFSQQCLSKLFYTVILSPVSLFMGACGLIFDLAIQYSVIKMSELINSGTVLLAWQTVRDFSNLLFIGVLLYAAVDTILGGGNAKKIIISVITAALLINFSLFFTKLLVDASNIVSLQFYNAASGGTPLSWQIANLTSTVTAYKPPNDVSFALSLIDGTPIGNALNLIGVKTGNGGGDLQILANILVSALLMIITSFVFLAGAILFIIRFFSIYVLLATSPLAFIGGTLPKLKSMVGDMWWKSLWNELLFAPAFMAMMWLSIKVLQQMANMATGSSSVLQDPNKLLNFVIVITFMLGSMIVAKKLGATGADFAQNIAGGATIGAAAFIGRNTIGKAASKFAESERFKNFAAKNPLLGEAGKRGLDRISSSTFDVRKPLKVLGADIGSTKSKGYEKDKDKRDKDLVKHAEYLSKGEGGDARFNQFLNPQSPLARFTSRLSGVNSDVVKKAQEEWDKKNIDKLKEQLEKISGTEALKNAVVEKQKASKKLSEELDAAEEELTKATNSSDLSKFKIAKERRDKMKVASEQKKQELEELQKKIKAQEDKDKSADEKELEERIKKAQNKKDKDEKAEETKKAAKEALKEEKENDKANEKRG